MATALIEFLELGNDRTFSGGAGAVKAVLGSTGPIAVIGSATAPASRPVAPTVPPLKSYVARVGCLVGSIAFTWGGDPTATEAAGIRVDAGHFRDVLVDPGTLISLIAISPVQVSLGGSAAAVSPALAAGDQAPISLNTRGAVRTVAQNPDGSDIDPTAPVQTVPARSGTFTTAQMAVTTAPPAAPVLAALTTRKRARLKNMSAAATAYVASTAAGATAAAGWPIAPGETYTVIEGYTGDLYALGSAALTLAVEQLA